MKRVLKLFTCLTVLVGSLAVLAPAPAAAQTGGTDPGTAGPTCEDSMTVDANCIGGYSDEVVVERDPTAPEGARCYRRTFRRLAESIIGVDLWAYYQRIEWCVRNGKLSSAERTRWAEVYAPGWQFQSHIGSNISGGRGTKSYTAFTQGKFRLCIVYCLQAATPWVRQTGRADGSYSATAGG